MATTLTAIHDTVALTAIHDIVIPVTAVVDVFVESPVLGMPIGLLLALTYAS